MTHAHTYVYICTHIAKRTHVQAFTQCTHTCIHTYMVVCLYVQCFNINLVSQYAQADGYSISNN